MNQGINVLTKKPEKSSTSTSETGMIPRIYETGPIPSIGEESNGGHEPPQPATLPELDDASSITGVLHIKHGEGEDADKHADDAPTENSMRTTRLARR